MAMRFSGTAAANDQTGSWSAPFDLGGVAIHATLMHNDDVLFFQYVEGAAEFDRTSYVATWNWRTGALRQAPFADHRDVFCAAHNVLADGRVFVAGGHDPTTGKKQDAFGVVECDIYDPVARTWTRTAPLGQKRWYPTNVGLRNGRTLIFGGTASPGVPSTTVDEYDAITNTMRRLPTSANKSVGQYPTDAPDGQRPGAARVVRRARPSLQPGHQQLVDRGVDDLRQAVARDRGAAAGLHAGSSPPAAAHRRAPRRSWTSPRPPRGGVPPGR